jgi:hypothetical protein
MSIELNLPQPPNINQKNVNTLITSLPNDIIKMIYNDHFSLEALNNNLQRILESEDACKLRYDELALEVPKILENKEFVNYLLERNIIFKKLYDTHIIQNKNMFVLMNRDNSFALSWLMYLYH